MALLQVQFNSETLDLCCSANVILPQSSTRAQEREMPVLYLLHGYSDDHTAWVRQTSIERHANLIAPEFMVVMPAVDHSFYSDMKSGNKYWTFISEELPVIISSMFPLSGRREDTFVAGLSMGGYGAMKLLLNHPEKFLAGASLSGACDMNQRLKGMNLGDKFNQEMRYIFGSEEEFLHSSSDLKYQAERMSKGTLIPEIYMSCGTSDFLYENNLGFLKHLRGLGLNVEWEATPDRDHTWDYWDEQIAKVLRWFWELRLHANKDIR